MAFKHLSEEQLGRGVFLELRRVTITSPAGTVAIRDVVRHPGGVAVLAFDGDQVLLIRQYRVAVDATVLELPAGKLDASDPNPEAAAGRELAEETGFLPTELTSLGELLPSPGYTDEVIHLYVSEGIVPAAKRSPDGVEEHHAEIVRLDFQEALAMVDAGEITDAKTQIALLRWQMKRSQG